MGRFFRRSGYRKLTKKQKIIFLIIGGVIILLLAINELIQAIGYTENGVQFRRLRGKDAYAVIGARGVNVVIPETFKGKPVTKIDYQAFYERPYRERSPLKSIVLPETITSIGGEAFYDCWYLTTINIPDSVTYIGADAFCGCSELSYIPIPKAMTVVGEAAFRESCIIELEIPENVTGIEKEAFAWCGRLTSVTIDNSVTTIGKHAFEGCEQLTEICFEGTMAEWNAMQRAGSWNDGVPATEVVCLDGSVAL